MSLEDLLKPVKYVDEQVLRGYTKAIKKYEEKGYDKYKLSLLLTVSSFLIRTSTGVIWYKEIAEAYRELYKTAGFCFSGLSGIDVGITINQYSDKEITTETKVELSPTTVFGKKITKTVRLPLLIGGLGFLGNGAANLIDYIKTRDNQSLSWGIHHLLQGYSMVSLASSIYIKDTNPKLLEKKPFYKTAYDWVKEQLSIAPEPVTTYSALEEKI